MNRKQFIKKSGLLCLSCLGAATILESCSSAYYAVNTLEGNRLVVKRSEFLQEIKGKVIQHTFVLVKTTKFDEPIYLAKLSEDKYSALLMNCTHKGCELNANKEYLVCPCHGSEFSNEGKVLEGPAERDLQKFYVLSDSENIYIQL